MFINTKLFISIFLASAFLLSSPLALSADHGWGRGGHKGGDWENKKPHWDRSEWGGQRGKGHHHHGHKQGEKLFNNDVILVQREDGMWVAGIRGPHVRLSVLFPDYPQFASLGKGASEYEAMSNTSAYTLHVYKDLAATQKELGVQSLDQLAESLADATHFTPPQEGDWTYQTEALPAKDSKSERPLSVFSFLTKGVMGNDHFLIRQIKVVITDTGAFVAAETHFTSSKKDAEEAEERVEEKTSPAVLELSDTPFLNAIEAVEPDNALVIYPFHEEE